MTNTKLNWQTSIGLLLISIVLTTKQFFDVPEFLCGSGMGLGLFLELYGLYCMKHDISKIKAFKCKLLNTIVVNKH